MMMILIEPDELHGSCQHSMKRGRHTIQTGDIKNMTKNAESRFNGVGRDAWIHHQASRLSFLQKQTYAIRNYNELQFNGKSVHMVVCASVCRP